MLSSLAVRLGRPRADYTARRASRRITLECPPALLFRSVPNMRTGGRILVDNLLLQGVELAFCVPGESYLPVLDALYDVRDRLRLIVCRQEGGATYMAEAYGKLTGRPGIVFVTRGPGASNAAIGIHTAAQDSTPLIVFVGQVGSDFADREAFQEIDYRRMYGSIVKWVAQIERAERIPEYVARAFRVAQSGRPGPVLLALPEDMLAATAAVADVARVDVPVVQPAPAQTSSAACISPRWRFRRRSRRHALRSRLWRRSTRPRGPAAPRRLTPNISRGRRRSRCRARSISGRSSRRCANGFPRTRSSPAAPVIMRPGCTGCIAIPRFARSSRRTTDRWVTAWRRRLPPRPRIPTARSFPGTAMVAS